MFIELTAANGRIEGKKIYLNTDHIIYFRYSLEMEGGCSVIFDSNNNKIFVTETPEEIFRMFPNWRPWNLPLLDDPMNREKNTHLNEEETDGSINPLEGS